MVQVSVGRPKKPAKRRNYKISFDVLAKLQAIAKMEDRSDTAQLERFIKEGSERWEAENPNKQIEYKDLVKRIQSDLEASEDADQ
jgi:hypothetical protein